MVKVPLSNSFLKRRDARRKFSEHLGAAPPPPHLTPRTRQRIPLLRPVKPCPGVPGIHLNADRTVSMTAARLCGAGASPVHKDRGCSTDHDQIEDYAHAQRHAWEMLLWSKNGAHRHRARLARARRPKLLRRSRKVCLWSSIRARITSPVYWQHVWTW